MAHHSGSDHSQFLAATATASHGDNEVHLLHLSEPEQEEGEEGERRRGPDDPPTTLDVLAYRHPAGPVWHMSSPTRREGVFATTYTTAAAAGDPSTHRCRTSLWAMDKTFSPGSGVPEREQRRWRHGLHRLREVARVEEPLTRTVWGAHGDGLDLLGVTDTHLHFFFDAATTTSTAVAASEGTTVPVLASRQSVAVPDGPICGAAWSPHRATDVACAAGRHLHGWDTRNPRRPAFTIRDAHALETRSLAYNPNRDAILATAGDDGRVRVWDVRATTDPLLTLYHHTHWYPQLLLLLLHPLS